MIVSKPKSAVPSYPSEASEIKGKANKPLSVHVDEALMLNSLPRSSAQLLGSVVVHPAGVTTHKDEPELDMSTRTFWGGVPTCTVKEDQGPSLPSLP